MERGEDYEEEKPPVVSTLVYFDYELGSFVTKVFI